MWSKRRVLYIVTENVSASTTQKQQRRRNRLACYLLCVFLATATFKREALRLFTLITQYFTPRYNFGGGPRSTFSDFFELRCFLYVDVFVLPLRKFHCFQIHVCRFELQCKTFSCTIISPSLTFLVSFYQYK